MWASEFGCPNQFTGLPNALDTMLMVLHVSQASQMISYWIGLILVTCFLGNKSWKVGQKAFGSSLKNSNRKEIERKKTRMAFAKLFAVHVNAIIWIWK